MNPLERKHRADCHDFFPIDHNPEKNPKVNDYHINAMKVMKVCQNGANGAG